VKSARRWQAEVNVGQVTRAEVARREEISHAGVAQAMKLLSLDPDEQDAISRDKRPYSVHQAIALAEGGLDRRG